MKYSDNIIIQKFIERLVDAFKYENECRESDDKKFDIPFLVSGLWEDLTDNYKHYDKFCSDLRYCDDYDIEIHDSNYHICKVNVIIYNGDGWGNLKTYFEYEITFGYNERNWGYCKCTPDDPDYREDKHCCGHGCDWDAPNFTIRKSLLVSSQGWYGDEHDYWDFEDKFYSDDKEEKEKKLLTEREYKIKSLKETIENAQRELKELENL